MWAEGSLWVLLRWDWGWEEERAAVGRCLALPILPPATAALWDILNGLLTFQGILMVRLSRGKDRTYLVLHTVGLVYHSYGH